MEAPRRPRPTSVVTAVSMVLLALAACPTVARAAKFRTPNFVVTAPSDAIARQVGETAEIWRKRLAHDWLGREMKQWYRPCRVTVNVGRIGAGGATTFSFDRGHVFGWKMRVQGTLERILDSVIPHEVSHTIFACRFRRPLPRWADEGAASLVEHASEKRVHQMRLQQVLNTRRRIPLRKLLVMKEYPRDMQQTLVLYAEGFSLADFLVQQAGKSNYLRFLDDAYRNGWDRAVKQQYGFSGVDDLEKRWTGWVTAGSPRRDIPTGEQLASNGRHAGPGRGVTVRSQSPDGVRRRSIPLPGSRRETVADASPDASPVAPSPRRREHATSHPSRARATLGRLRALNAGWVPVVRKRRGIATTVAKRPVITAPPISHEKRKAESGQPALVAEPAFGFPLSAFVLTSSFGGFPVRGRAGKASLAGRRQSPRDVDGSRSPHVVPVARFRIPLRCSGPFSP